ncbi:BnaCnng59770D [Brassica napus]|uniref:BnaCnng59770D protein n=1 Tax=Brassica napus TaxID=3708 RepID=A0A078JQ83_BRANA|nr:BnaCnng59770D [Brassica napus]
MIHHPRSTFNEVSSCKAVEIQVLKVLHPSSRNHPIVYRSTLMSQFPSSTKTIRRLLPIQWPQPQSEEICLAMEEAEFEEKKMAMEIATPAPAPITSPEINIILSPAKTETHKKNMIQVSNTKNPLFFDVNLDKREIGLVDLVLIPERSLAFISIMMVVTISEILKNTGLTRDKKELTSTVGMKDEAKGKMIEIVLGKSDKFDSLVPPVTNGKTP